MGDQQEERNIERLENVNLHTVVQYAFAVPCSFKDGFIHDILRGDASTDRCTPFLSHVSGRSPLHTTGYPPAVLTTCSIPCACASTDTLRSLADIVIEYYVKLYVSIADVTQQCQVKSTSSASVLQTESRS